MWLRDVIVPGRFFRDRRDAGRVLAEALESYRSRDPLILGIPRGGVVVAAEVARRLGADLDLVVARKLGAPGQSELAIGAVTADGGRWLNGAIVSSLGVDSVYIDDVTRAETAEALGFLLDSRVDALQATILTPFPGTPLFEEMDRDGRIFDKDWSHYDFNHVVFDPRHMSRETLDHGVSWVLREFHTRTAIGRRVWRASRYLGLAFTLAAVLPINLGWRDKLTKDGNFGRGARFKPSPHADAEAALNQPGITQ